MVMFDSSNNDRRNLPVGWFKPLLDGILPTPSSSLTQGLSLWSLYLVESFSFVLGLGSLAPFDECLWVRIMCFGVILTNVNGNFFAY